MNKALVYGYLPILVLMLVPGPFIVSPSTDFSPTHFSATASSLNCNQGFDYYDRTFPISVLVIRSGSVGRICVEYSNYLNGFVSGPSYVSVFQYNSTGSYGVCPGCSLNEVTSNFKVTASPANVAVARGSGEDVNYTILIPHSVKSGIFGIFIFQFCSLFPMVVVPDDGPDVLITSSEFSSWYPHYGSCPSQVLSRAIIGVGGFQVVSLWTGFVDVGGTTGQTTQSEILRTLD